MTWPWPNIIVQWTGFHMIASFMPAGVTFIKRWGSTHWRLQTSARWSSYSPTKIWGYTGRGTTYRAMGKYDLALADNNKVIELLPDQDLSYAGRGETYRAMGKYDLALADFGKAVELFPASNSGYAKRGEIYRGMGKYDKALAEYDKIVQLYPRQ